MISEIRWLQISVLEETIGYHFKDSYILNMALTHKSYTNEQGGDLKNNERFEFLGDAVLDLIVSDYSMHTFLTSSEGILSKIRATVVNESCLANIARRLKLGEFLLLGKGEEYTGGREKKFIVSGCV